MKPLQLKDDIIPLATFRARAAEMMRRVTDDGRPVVITQRGRSVGVVMSPGDYDALMQEREVMRRVLRGLEASEAGRMVDDDEVWAEVEELLGEQDGLS